MGSVQAVGDEQIGLAILKRALEAPVRKIAENAGKDGAVVAEEVKKREGSVGYNAERVRYEDLVMAGIIDPTKVTRSALQNAASIAALFLTTECVIAEKPKKDDDKMPAGGGMEGMGGMGGMGGGMGY